jgi:hypothetical protein
LTISDTPGYCPAVTQNVPELNLRRGRPRVEAFGVFPLGEVVAGKTGRRVEFS